MRPGSWKTAVPVAAILASAALVIGAPVADAKDDVVVKRFLLGRLEPNTNKFVATGGRGTQNAFRDNVLMFVFSAPVDFKTLDPRTVRIGIPASANLFIDAEGTYYRYRVNQFDPVSGTFVEKRTYMNRILFDPTSRNEEAIYQNPYGFEETSLYSVTVPGTDQGHTKVVKGTAGQMNLRTFTTTFRTTDRFLQDYNQPSIAKIEANDAPGIPLDGRTNVDSRADVIVYFSEPMLPSTFDPNLTLRVYNFGQNRYVSGSIRPSPDGLYFTFRPAFGYGRGPYNIQVTVASTVTDRSGNVLDKGAVVNFTTEFDPLAPNYNEVVEDFDDQYDADWTYTTLFDRASWNGWIGNPSNPANNTNKNQGLLAGIFGAKVHEILFSYNNGDGIPFYVNASRAQQLYTGAQMGATPRTISGFVWHVYPGYSAGGVPFSGTSVHLGHNTSGNLNTNLTGSYSDTPVTVVNNITYTPNPNETEWYTGPAFTTNWGYNGRDNAVIDILDNGSGSSVPYWRMTQAAPQGGICRVRVINGVATGYTWAVDIRFLYLVDKSEAQSNWYDTLQNSPTWLDPIVLQTVPPGTVSSIAYQGGHENPLLPGTVDPNTLTSWSTDPFTDLGGCRYIRIHVEMTSNLGSSTRPTIEQVKLPFIFF